MTPQTTDEQGVLQEARASDEPVRWRIGKLTVVFVGVVVAGLGFNEAISGDPPSEPGGVIVDVSRAPRGVLGGQTAPDLSFPLFDGSTFDMTGHFATDGRPIVLNLWASWCFPCRTEMPEFSALAEQHPDVAFVGVAVDDSRVPAEEFADEIRVSYPLGIDHNGDVAGAYPFIGLPTTYLISSDRIVTHQIQGQVTGPVLEAFIEYDFGG